MFETLAASPVTRAVGLALLHFLWQGAVIAAAAAWLLHVLRRAAAANRYLVGCARSCRRWRWCPWSRPSEC